MAKILYGKPVKEGIKNSLIKSIEALGRPPVLAIIQVGDRADSNIYIKQKQKFGEEIGAKVIHKKFEAEIKEGELLKEIEKINKDKGIDGVIIQLPLPESLDREKILGRIEAGKDSDGLSGLDLNGENLVTPATARGVAALLDFYEIEVGNKKVAVIGRSKLAGGPIAEILKGRGASVSVCHKGTDLEEMKKICRGSNILISAAGQAGLVTKEFVKEGQVVVDVGINRTPPLSLRSDPPLDQVREERITIVGDVAFAEVEPIVSAISPVPGGIGPLTVACLFQNLLDLIKG